MKMRCQKARKSISLAIDSRLEPEARERLQTHLQDCLSCRSWQQEQAGLRDLIKTQPDLSPSPRFATGLLDRIHEPQARPWFSIAMPVRFQPAWGRVAMIVLLMLSTALGFFLAGPLLDTPADSQDAAFRQAMNLDAFADLPGDSFGAVYERLLQGELQ